MRLVPNPITTLLDEIGQLSDDLNPTLEGNLDVNGFQIISKNNGDISIQPDGSGQIILENDKWPVADGTTGQVLTTDGSGDLYWSTVSGGGSFTWNVVTSSGNPHQIVASNGYICSSTSQVTFLLPLAPTVGDTFKIFSYTSTFQIIPNGGQQMIIGIHTGVSGSSGTLTSQSQADMVTITYMGGNIFQSEAPQGSLILIT